MVKTLLAVLCFSCSFGAFAQMNVPQWETIKNDAAISDSVRWNELEKYAMTYHLTAPFDTMEFLIADLRSMADLMQATRLTGMVIYLQASIEHYKGNNKRAVALYEQALEHYEKYDHEFGTGQVLVGLGTCYKDQGMYVPSLQRYRDALAIWQGIGYKRGEAVILNSIGVLYDLQYDNETALRYYTRAAKMFKSLELERHYATGLDNIGDVHFYMGHMDSAEHYAKLQYDYCIEIGWEGGLAAAYFNMAEIFFSQDQYDSALLYFTKSFELDRKYGHSSGVPRDLYKIGFTQLRLGKVDAAITACEEAYEILTRAEAGYHRMQSCECLYQSYKAKGNTAKALEYHELVMEINANLDVSSSLQHFQEMEFEKVRIADSLAVEEKKLRVELNYQKQLQKRNRQRDLGFGTGLVALILALGFYSRWKYIKDSRDTIAKEKERSENLLLNILPAEIAEELKANGEATARDFDPVTILFTDFKEFTRLSEKLSAKELVAELNYCFKAFDEICEKYRIEKIKTLGDSFMATGGLPVPRSDSAHRVVLAALEMQLFVVERARERKEQGQTYFEMRAGIHTGPVVAGIVGVKKFQYDVWGDTVNTASRMETAGVVGKVNISQATYEVIKDDPQFTFEHRGKVEAKGKGEIEMYFVQHEQP